MKLKKCLEIGKGCGLKFLGECYNNVYFYFGSVFRFEDMEKEFEELRKESDLFDIDTPIEAIMDAYNWEWYYETEQDEKYGCPSLREKVV